MERILGEQIKVLVRVKDGNYNLDDCEWSLQVWCSTYKVVTIKKDECISLGDGAYVYMLNTEDVGAGSLRCKVVAEVDDGDYDDAKATIIGACPVLGEDDKQITIVRYGRP